MNNYLKTIADLEIIKQKYFDLDKLHLRIVADLVNRNSRLNWENDSRNCVLSKIGDIHSPKRRLTSKFEMLLGVKVEK